MEVEYGIFGCDFLRIKNCGTIWTFEHKDGKILLNNSETESSGKSSWLEVGADFCSGFSFTFTPERKIHIIYKNNKEQIVYSAFSDKGEQNIFNITLPDREKITYHKIIYNKNKRLFIIIFTEEPIEKIWKIYGLTQENGGWSDLEVIDHGGGFSQGQGAVGVGSEGRIYLVYQIFAQGKYHLIYRVNNNNCWSNPMQITSSPEMNFNPFISVDNKGILHLVWLRFCQGNSRVMYSHKTRIQSFWTRWQWSREQQLSTLGASSPSIISKENTPEIFWQQREGGTSYVYRYFKTGNEVIKIIDKSNQIKAGSIVLNLNKYQDINYTAIERGSTVFLLLADVFESIGSEEYIEAELNEELLKTRGKVKKLEMINAKLQNKIVEKEEKFHGVRKKLESKNFELEKEIDRLKQSLEAVQKANEDLRKRLKEEEISGGQSETKMINPIQRKGNPFFPFLRK